LNNNAPNQLKLQCGSSLPVFLWSDSTQMRSKGASAEKVTTACWRKVDKGVKWHREVHLSFM